MAKNYATATVALSSGNNTLIEAPAALSEGLGSREIYIRKLTVQLTGTGPVTIIIKNGSGRELEHRWVLSDTVPAILLMYDGSNEIGVGGGEPLIINASSTGVSARVEYRTGTSSPWPA